jgi:hypothetical protein
MFNGSNRPLISNKTERSDLHIAQFDTSLSNCNTIHVIRKRSSFCRSVKYSRKMAELADRYIRHVLWSYKVLFYISSIPILVPILRCVYPIPHNIFEIHFNIILSYLQPGPPSGFVPRGFPTKILHSLLDEIKEAVSKTILFLQFNPLFATTIHALQPPSFI